MTPSAGAHVAPLRVRPRRGGRIVRWLAAAVVLVVLAAPSETFRSLVPFDPELVPLALRALGAAVLYFGVVALAWRFGRTRIAG
jgi:hypothetical protein